MFALVWWCYPIVMACVAVPMAFFWYVENRRDAREEREAGPFPCLAYMGRDVYQGELWCWLQLGHDDEHVSQFGLDDDTVFTREWDEAEEHADCDPPCCVRNAEGDLVLLPCNVRPLPPLPQRLSKVPAQGNRPCKATFSDPCPGDCWGENGCTRDH